MELPLVGAGLPERAGQVEAVELDRAELLVLVVLRQRGVAEEVGRVRLEHEGLVPIGQGEQVVRSAEQALDLLEVELLLIGEVDRRLAAPRVASFFTQLALRLGEDVDE